MPPNLSKIKFSTGNLEFLSHLKEPPVLPVFSGRAVSFLSALSRALLGDPRSRKHADLMSYAFFIRKASLEALKQKDYAQSLAKMGRGVALHIVPSNVALTTAISFTAALLSGNVSILRLSSKHFEQIDILVDALRALFSNEFADMERYLILVRYEHDRELTEYLSSQCDVRIIWGGDQTIRLIREAPLPPRAIELTFADRYSLALMDSEQVLACDIEKLASAFYTDTYFFDQNACSSPRIVIWTGDQVQAAQARFWPALQTMVREKYSLTQINVIDKMDALFRLAVDFPEVKLLSKKNGAIVRVQVPALSEALMRYKMGGGFFFEYSAASLEEVLPLLGTPCQTVGLFGVAPKEIYDLVCQHGVQGVDRIVPIGTTSDISFRWDGYDLIDAMSRYVAVSTGGMQ